MKGFEKRIEKIVKDKEFLVSFLSGATYGSYWASASVHDDTPKEVREAANNNNECREEVWADVLLNNGFIEIYDNEEDEAHKISLDDVISAFEKLILEYPNHYSNIMTEYADLYDYDAWLQCAVFGDVIYG